MWFVRSRPLSGNSTVVSILSVNGPFAEKRLRWMRSTGGSRDNDSRFVAFLSVLQCGQCLWDSQMNALELDKDGMSHHASDLSITSSFTNASMHCCNGTFALPLFGGTGSVRYMKVLYVVDVCCV